MKNNYIVLYYKTGSKNLAYYMYKDLAGVEGIELCSRERDSSNKYLHYFYARLKKHINEEKIGHSTLGKVLMASEAIRKVQFSKDKANVIFINDQGLYKYYVDLLLEIKRKYSNTVFVVQWLNAVSTVPFNCYEQMKRLNPNLILTDDPDDAEKYGWVFWMDCLSTIDDIKPGKKSDVFFAGVAKDREKKIVDAYVKLKDNGINCDFTIVGKQNNDPGISRKYLEYRELLARDMGANCLLEIMQSGQRGYTCRAQEAIVLNKKLLTNNKWIVNSKYYNPQFIKVFEEIGDEEIAFVKKNISVDYQYDGGFSPWKLIEYLEKTI